MSGQLVSVCGLSFYSVSCIAGTTLPLSAAFWPIEPNGERVTQTDRSAKQISAQEEKPEKKGKPRRCGFHDSTHLVWSLLIFHRRLLACPPCNFFYQIVLD